LPECLLLREPHVGFLRPSIHTLSRHFYLRSISGRMTTWASSWSARSKKRTSFPRTSRKRSALGFSLRSNPSGDGTTCSLARHHKLSSEWRLKRLRIFGPVEHHRSTLIAFEIAHKSQLPKALRCITFGGPRTSASGVPFVSYQSASSWIELQACAWGGPFRFRSRRPKLSGSRHTHECRRSGVVLDRTA
jgi:hypothetical protein